MEVRKGYKQTEVGVIPEDWNLKQLRDVATYHNGKSYEDKVDETGDYFLITLDSLDIRGKLKPNHKKVSRVDMPLSKNDLIMILSDVAHGYFLGLTDLIPENEKYILNQRIGALKANSNIDPHFLSFFINHHQSYFKIAGQGSSQQNLSKSDIQNFNILVPALAEQEAIAEALSDADALIESLETLLAKKRQVKQGAMSELLSGKRRVVENGEWKETSLGELGKIYRGVSYNPNSDLSSSDTDTTVRLLRSNNIQESTVVFSDMQYVGVDKVSKDQIMQKNDVLICMANGSKSLVGKAGRFSNDDGFQYTFGAFMGCFRPYNQVVNPDFTFYLFLTQQYRSHISILLAGSSINNLTPTNVEAFTISIPVDMKEQSAIAKILSDMDAEIRALEGKLSKARAVKAGMMSELLTGRVRLPP